ncbi:MAG: PAS domain S-box protein [Thermomicrobiales bacterium]|nr:PAS domain S-box protein [Thermomicrobiales bacterium]
MGSDDLVTPMTGPGAPDAALLQAIVQSAMDAIVVLDAEQRIVSFNPAAEQMFRCSAAAALGQPLDRFLPARYREQHQRHIAAFGITGGTTRSMGHLRPLTGLRANGEEFPIEATIARVDVRGAPYFAAIVRDITARLAAEASLRRQVELLNLAYDAIFTWTWDGEITFWNAGAERLYGYPATHAVGRRSRELLRTDHPAGGMEIAQALEDHRVWEGELIHRRRDGRVVVVESRHVLVEGEGGRYVLEADRDITERRQAEAEHARSVAREAAARAEAAAAAAARDRLQDILDDLPGGVVLMTEPEGRVELTNAAMRQMIRGPADPDAHAPVCSQDLVFAWLDGSLVGANERPGLRALRGERVQNQQLLLVRPDGTTIPIAVHVALLRDGPGMAHRVIVFVQDVTQLRQAEQLKDDFLALVSHELRTPLSVIHGGAQVLVNKPHLDEDMRRELLLDVVAESERLERLLSNLLALTDITAGRLQAALEPVLLEPLIARTAADFRRRSAVHTFTVEVDRSLPPAEADPDLLEVVVRNLYENAIKYAPHGGAVRTTAEVDGESVVIRVADEGIGTAPEHVAGVFERFRRVGGDHRVRGMGLGLYLCRGLIDAQGGTIEASSPGPGQGSTFTVTLPVARGWAASDHT